MIEPHLQFIGADYEPGASGPQRYDCSGVCGAYLEALGFTVPQGAFQGIDGDIWRLRGSLDEVELERGDVVLSLQPDGQLHVDVAINPRRVLTALKGRGVAIRRTYSITNPLGVYRLRK